ncbi:MAG: hypothetical protein WC916_01060 [Candidatus Woesearchaeota archaeon]
MVDYKKIGKKVIITITAIAASILILRECREMENVSDKARFNRLPKATQEVVLKLEVSGTSKDTLLNNISGLDQARKNAERFNELLMGIEKFDTVGVKPNDRVGRGMKIMLKWQKIHELESVLDGLKRNRKLITVLDRKPIDDLIAEITAVIAQQKADIKELEK